MKKVTILGIVLILLAVSVVPVLAKDPPHGKGNQGNAGQGNSTGVNPGGTEQEKQDRQTNNNGKRNGNQGQGNMLTPFYLQGVITAVDQGAKTVTVTLIHGNAKVKQFIGTDLIIKATDATQIFQVTQGNEEGPGSGEAVTPSLSSSENERTATTILNSDEPDGNRVPKTFADLAVGQKVAIHGRLLDSVYTARLITFYVPIAYPGPAGG